MTNFKKKSILYPLIATGLILSLGQNIAFAEDTPSASEDDQAIEQKVKARLLEIDAEAKAANREKNGYYVERKSYGTGKETDPPRYVKQANKTWLKDYDAFADVDWLDLGLEYRSRFEHRDNDFRRADQTLDRRGDQTIDEPLLLRTRAYVGVKNILDPFRFVLELQDSRRNLGGYTREYDTRDVNNLHILQGYLELNFKQTFLGKDQLGNDRPIWIRAGRHAWEAGDRRLIARNEWRNTTNNFSGLRANIGQKKNDWELEMFAVKPVQRFTRENDETDDSQDFYGGIFNYRGWSDVVTLEPFYFLLKQDGNKVKYDTLGQRVGASAKIDREINTAGLRAYGVIPGTQFDFDGSYNKQWGEVQRFNSTTKSYREVDHDAHAYNIELGYSIKHPWKPRLSAFYGLASGDSGNRGNSDNSSMERFDRLFGFARPWSNDDYIQMENIRTPKVRLEFEPKLSFLDNVKVDTGFSWYRLDSASDRWNAGGNLTDTTGKSGKDLGTEYDLRVRFPINQYASLNLGYAYFWGGDFVKNRIAASNDKSRDANSEFFYTELTILGF